jgi:hypothetical protein
LKNLLHMSLWRFTTFVTVLPIAHSPVFKIFDLTQISIGFLMSVMGQKQTSDCRLLMSALPPKADIVGRSGDVRFVPIADIPPFQSIVVGADGRCHRGQVVFCPTEFG